MSVFQHQYATIDEAWGQPLFSPTIVNRYKEAPDQNLQASSQASQEPSEQAIRRYLNAQYTKGGIEGVKRILDPAIIRDIQAEWARKHETTTSPLSSLSLNLERDDWLYVMLGLFALLFALDSSS